MEFDYSSGYSRLACRRCKQLKRKCNKVTPKCGSCEKTRFKCIYEDIRASQPKAADYPPHSQPASPPIVGTISAVGPDTGASNVCSVYFLDYGLFQRTIGDIPRNSTFILPEIQVLAQDIREQSKIYFHTIHPWMPFLSQRSFNERLLSPFSTPSADVVLLFASVKLICTLPGGDGRRTYLTVKSALLQAEVTGIFTIRILQAWILLCLYEMGHAIYPSAYLSIGTCARYATALGVNMDNTDSPEKSYNWIDSEERVRAWWAVVILDRFSNLGHPYTSLATEDPGNNTQLPIDDTSWNEGIVKQVRPATLSTPPTALIGRYGLMAQAASLLGRVLRHKNEPENDTPIHEEEAVILDRTLRALTIVANEEGSARGIGVCTPTVICHSARISLAACRLRQNAAPQSTQSTETPENFVFNSGIAADIRKLSRWWASESGPTLEDELSLFPLEAAYRTAISYLETYHESQDEEHLEGFLQIKDLLVRYNHRWSLAGEYIRFLEAREAIWTNSQL